MKGSSFIRLLTEITCCIAFVQPMALPSSQPRTVRGVDVSPTFLIRDNNPQSPYCFVASSITSFPSTCNFLATQVWPSARFASMMVKHHASRDWTVCEFGCGPGLPALTAASMGCSVLASDLDEFALDLVEEAAEEQGWNIRTKQFDLVSDGMQEEKCRELMEAVMGKKLDLVLFSDVFEHENVGKGAAHVTKYFLDRGTRVWTFAQSDRAQRESYCRELTRILESDDELKFGSSPYDPQNLLWLCDLDETTVVYG